MIKITVWIVVVFIEVLIVAAAVLWLLDTL